MTSSNRSGYTMHELVWAFTLSSMIMAISVAWIHQTSKFSRRMAQNKLNHNAMTQLAWDLRDEVRGCNKISLDEKQQLNLTWDSGQTATFKIEGSNVVFEKKVSKTQVNKESYEFGRNLKISWDDSELPTAVSLVIERTLDVKKPLKEDKNVSTTADDQGKPLPIDLVVRVSPNRWSQQPPKEADQ